MNEDDLEVHPLNHQVSRVEGGIWNEHLLPVLNWEVAEFRVIVPASLHPLIGELGCVLRWPSAKFERLLSQRPREMALAKDLTTILAMWRYVGRDTLTDFQGRELADICRYRILSFHEGRWFAISVGRDTAGSDNVITVISSRNSTFLRNRIRGLSELRERGW